MGKRRKYKDGIYHDAQGRLIEREGYAVRLYWSKPMLDYLIANYATTKNEELAEHFCMSPRTISHKAASLGLHKSEKWLAELRRESMALAALHNRTHGNSGQFKKGTKVGRPFLKGHRNEEWEKKRLEGLMRFYKNPVLASAKAHKAWETRRRMVSTAKTEAAI